MNDIAVLRQDKFLGSIPGVQDCLAGAIAEMIGCELFLLSARDFARLRREMAASRTVDSFAAVLLEPLRCLPNV